MDGTWEGGAAACVLGLRRQRVEQTDNHDGIIAYGCLDTGAKGHRGRVGEEERGKNNNDLKRNGSMRALRVLTGA